MFCRREFWRLWIAVVGLRGVSVCRRKRQASMRRKRKNTGHLSHFLKVIKSPVDLVVSAIIVRMRCSHFFKPARALTQHAQLDCSNECKCGVPLTSSQLLECTIRTFPHPTRTQIMSATFLSPPLDLLVFDVLQVVQQILLNVLFHVTAIYSTGLPYITWTRLSTAYIAVTNAGFFHFVKFLQFRCPPISLFTKTFCPCSVFTCFV